MSARSFVWPKRQDWLAPTAPQPPPLPKGFNRRAAALGSLAAMLAAPALEAASAAAHPDAELIALCRRLMDLEDRRRQVINAMPDHYDWQQEKVYDAEHVDPIEQERTELLEQMEPIRARTPAGLLARIELTVKEYPHLIELDGGEDSMIAAILLDGLALKAGGLA